MLHDNDGDVTCTYHQCCASHGRILWLVLATIVATGCAQLPEVQLVDSQGRITKGPYLLRVYGDRAALMWETDAQGQWGVSCGTRGRHDRYIVSTAEKVTYSGRPGDGGSKAAYIHKVWIDGLVPGRTYAYRIVGPDVRSDVYRFRTIPAATDEVRFIVYGDTRNGPDTHRQLVRQMIKCNADFVVHTGDMADRGDDYPQWGPQVFEPLRGLVERVPIYVAKGNHEGQNGNFEKLFIPPGEENDLGFDFGPLHYFCADNVSSPMDAGRLASRIIQDAQASQAPWKFVSYHVPSVNFGGHRSQWRQNEVLSSFADAGIDFVIVGHSHQYERFRPVEPSGQTGGYVTYITSAGGGAPLYPVEATALHAFARSAHHFCLFRIKGNALMMDAIDPEGRVIDHLEITKKDGRITEPYVSTAVPASVIRLHQALYMGIGVTLPDKLEMGTPCVVSVDVAVPPLSGNAGLTFGLRGDSGAYQLPPPHAVVAPREGGVISVALTVTPNAAVTSTSASGHAVPIEPPLWLDCHYEFGAVKATVSRPVMMR